MKKILVLAVAIVALASPAAAQVSTEITPPPRAELADGAPASTLLPALVQHSRHRARLENGRLTGEGADFLRSLSAQSQFVLIGESHGTEGVADFAAAYWRDLNAIGYNYAALEIDPWTAAALERELRADGIEAWRRYAEAQGGVIAAPFFTWAPEARLAQLVTETSRARRHPAIWGLDQVFQSAAAPILREVAQSARGAEARTLAADLAEQAAAAPMEWLANSDDAPLRALRTALRSRQDSEEAEAIDALIQSQRIYRPFTRGDGEAYLANLERETLMKQLFLENYRAAERADRAPPRVMLKFGSYHVTRGATPTHVQGLGGFVTEFAHTTGGGGALTVAVFCGPGSFAGSFDGAAASCTEGIEREFGFLADQIDGEAITIFDLRVWKLRPGRWEHLPADMRQFIDSYDVLVFVPNSPASTFLAGLTAPATPTN